MYKLEDFKPGDVLLITSHSNRGLDTRRAYVTCVDYNGNGRVTYADLPGSGLLGSGQGAFDPTKVGTTEYGLYYRVERTGETYTEPRRWYPKPGDSGYDLVNNPRRW